MVDQVHGLKIFNAQLDRQRENSVIVWLVSIGEAVPIHLGAKDRLRRTGSLARFLEAHGHQVVWWTSTFDHYRKRHICEEQEVSVSDRFRLRLLRGVGYSKNVGVARLVDHVLIARKFKRAIRNEPKPDIILAALPTIELCLASVRYGKRTGVPVVLDMRDMWPDIFLDAVPASVKRLVRVLMYPLFRQARNACAEATAIIGITDAFVQWGLRRGARVRSELDRAFPFAYSVEYPDPQAIEEARVFWDLQGVPERPGRLVVCYFGSLGKSLDLVHLIDAARLLHVTGQPVQFVICGAGERLEEYRHRASNLPNVIFPGWVDAAKIHVLMRRSQIGIDPLPDRYDFLASINNKAVEYMSASLPIVSSPRRGVLFELLAKEQCGVSYDSGDAHGLASLLTDLAGHREILNRMAANSGRIFSQQFEADKICAEMTDFLQRIVSSYRPEAVEPGIPALQARV